MSIIIHYFNFFRDKKGEAGVTSLHNLHGKFPVETDANIDMQQLAKEQWEKRAAKMGVKLPTDDINEDNNQELDD